MLIKEYRIPLPMSVDEYRIAQLYMIAKKSREETKGSGSGVEILVNEPYTSGPGGSGQFTHKVYHVGSHLPGWFLALLPRTALTVEEEAWNAYPYTKTRYRSPFVEKFSLEIETYYYADGGHQDNVFSLSDSEKRNRIVDLIDVVKDQDATFEDPSRDDPTVYVSQKTGRGPLSENWIEEYWEAVQRQRKTKSASTKSIMCAYKLCKVEFRYWGMQSRLERFIHDTALRKTMLKAHLQAWVWQDEWYGLNMEDIRAIEQETAELLRQALRTDEEAENNENSSAATDANSAPSLSLLPTPAGGVTTSSGLASPIQKTFESIAYPEKEMPHIIPKGTEVMPRRSICLTDGDARRMAEACSQYLQQQQATEATTSSSTLLRSKSANAASLGPKRSRSSRDEDSDDDSEQATEEDEFFDCRENLDDSASLAKWSSMELLPYEENGDSSGKRRTMPVTSAPSMESTTGAGVTFRRVQSLRECSSGSLSASRSEEDLLGPTPPHSASAVTSTATAKHPVIDIAEFGSDCPTSVLVLVAHGGSVLDVALEASVRKADVTTFRGALEHVTRAHYPGLVGRVAVKCVPCPPVCEAALSALSALSPYSFDVNPVGGFVSSSVGVSVDRLPVAAIPLLATANATEYSSAVARFVAEANRVYTDFLVSDAGRGFMGQVILVGDSVGGLLAYDALCNSTCTCATGRSKHTSGSTDGTFFGDAASAHSAESTLSPAPPPPPPPSSPRESVNVEQGQQGYYSHHNSLRLAPNRIAGGEFFPLSDSTDSARPKLDFDVTDFFLFGSPLGTLLAHRRAQQSTLDLTSWPGRGVPASASCALHPSRSSAPCSAHHSPSALASATSGASSASAGANQCSCCSSSSVPFATNRPPVAQVYNLFHPTDPLACRVEPLLCGRFSRAPPVNVARYHKYPMGDGQALSIIEFVHTNPGILATAEPGLEARPGHAPPLSRRVSEDSVASSAYDVASNIDDAQQLQAIAALKARWWGNRRVDFALYCPEGLSNFPANALPHIFHSSYWESPDVVAFVVRQMVRSGGGADRWTDAASTSVGSVGMGMGMLGITDFVPGQPREKWLKKRTSVKIRNGAPNHRANDVLVREGAPQMMVARFAYGPLDMSALTGERVDVYVIKEPPAGEWVHVATEVTDKSGRLALTLPPSETLGYGLYPVRMVVRGDHSMLHLSLAVVPPKTETVVFSIDGSFAASVSVTGKDPKVKAGAVDVVRHWQELGYLILYVTGRPDMQLQRVVSWLAQHNFPHGLVSFADGFTTDPLRHKAEYLRSLIHDHDVTIHCAYGSSKDIGVYASLGLKSDQIYIEGGKPSRKQAGQATFLTEGYAEHLSRLTAFGGSRPAQGNARMVLPKTSLGLPWQAVPMAGPGGLGRRRTMRQTAAKRTTSFPLNTFQAALTTPTPPSATAAGIALSTAAHQRQTSTAEGAPPT